MCFPGRSRNTRLFPRFCFPPLCPGHPTGLLDLDALYRTLDQRTVFLAFRDALLAIAVYIALVAVAIAFAAALSSTRVKESEELVLPSVAPHGRRRGRRSEAREGDGPYDSPDPESSDASGGASNAFATLEEEFQHSRLGFVRRRRSSQAAERGSDPPRSSLGWESYLEARLDAELQRSASFEQDLSLLLVSDENLHGESLPENKALLIPSRSSSVSAIWLSNGATTASPSSCPNIDVDHALRMSEEFVKKLDSRMEAFRNGQKPLPVFLGLASRTGRLVDSARMMQEALASLEKARSEGGARIVAFRPDPEKYRLYLASKGCA